MISISKICASGVSGTLKAAHLAGQPRVYKPQFGPAMTVTPDFLNFTLGGLINQQLHLRQLLDLAGEYGYQKVDLLKENRRGLDITFNLNDAASRAVFHIPDLLLCRYPHQIREQLSLQLWPLLAPQSALRGELAQREIHPPTSRNLISVRKAPQFLADLFKVNSEGQETFAEQMEKTFFKGQYAGRVILIFGLENCLVRRPTESLHGQPASDWLCYLDRREIHDAKDFIVQLETCLQQFKSGKPGGV